MAIKLTNTANVTDDATLELSGAIAATTVEKDGVTYLFVAGPFETSVLESGGSITIGGGLTVFAVGADGSLTHVQTVSDTDDTTIGGVSGLTTAVVGGKTYLFAGASEDDDDGVTVFEVGAGGLLASVESVTEADNPGFALGGAGRVTTAVVAGTTYLFVAANSDDGVSVFAVGADGSLTHKTSVLDDPTLGLKGAVSVVSAVVGGTTYLLVAGNIEHAVTVFAVGADGSLTHEQTVVDNATLELSGVSGLATAVVAGTTYLFTAATQDFGVSVFSVGADGTLTNVFNISDTAQLELLGAVDLTTALINGTTYLFVTAAQDSGMSVFAVAANGSLTNVANISDAGPLELDFAAGVATAVVGGTTYVFGTGVFDDGVSAFAVRDNSLDDSYVVDSLTDTVDETGGAGLDTILSSLSFSLADPLRAMGDIENLTLLGGAAINGTGNDLANSLTGNAASNILAGGNGNDQLFGEGGKDRLKGEDGDDLLVGGLGRDVQIGGGGADNFDFNKAAESRVGANHDLVGDFSHAQHDKIDLQTIDADRTTGGNQAFDFIGGAGFSNTAGELRLAGGFLTGDTNGNGIADFEIKVTGIGAGAASDFVL